MKFLEVNSEMTDEERKLCAIKVEHYECGFCNHKVRYPRYNHPIKVLKQRTGGCSEWAVAFTCLCVALGHKARLCFDLVEKDYIWTEVYLNEYKRWIHLDALEPQLIDSPLVYEDRFEINCVLAFSAEEVVDVT